MSATYTHRERQLLKKATRLRAKVLELTAQNRQQERTLRKWSTALHKLMGYE